MSKNSMHSFMFGFKDRHEVFMELKIFIRDGTNFITLIITMYFDNELIIPFYWNRRLCYVTHFTFYIDQ